MTIENNTNLSSLVSVHINEDKPGKYSIEGQLTGLIVEKILELGAKEITLNNCILKQKYFEVLADYGAKERIVFNKCLVSDLSNEIAIAIKRLVPDFSEKITVGVIRVGDESVYYDPRIDGAVPANITIGTPDDSNGSMQWEDLNSKIAERIAYGRALIEKIDHFRSSVLNCRVHSFLYSDSFSDTFRVADVYLLSKVESLYNHCKHINQFAFENMKTVSDREMESQLNKLNDCIKNVEKELENCKSLVPDI